MSIRQDKLNETKFIHDIHNIYGREIGSIVASSKKNAIYQAALHGMDIEFVDIAGVEINTPIQTDGETWDVIDVGVVNCFGTVCCMLAHPYKMVKTAMGRVPLKQMKEIDIRLLIE